jgi:MoxR-like ATPase
MAEQQVTVDGETRILPDPFLLLATENPIEYEGTFPLPEAQLDRFFLKTALGYPDAEDERRILSEQRTGHPLRLLEPVISVEDVQELKAAAQDVYVDDLIQQWIVDLVRVTRQHESVSIGASVRGSLALERAARGWALLNDRSFVVPDDVERLFVPVLMHRIVFRPAFLAEARRDGWADASARFTETCLALAPRPVADPDGELYSLGRRSA